MQVLGNIYQFQTSYLYYALHYCDFEVLTDSCHVANFELCRLSATSVILGLIGLSSLCICRGQEGAPSVGSSTKIT
jgi:hypothetical protein